MVTRQIGPRTQSCLSGNPLSRNPLSGERYYSRAFAAREWEAVWARSWLLLGRASDIPEPGDFIVEDVGPESILMVRQKDGSIKAFYNICQHRGNKLMAEPEGAMDSFTCPYHGWKYDLEGRCIHAQDEEDFASGSPCTRVRLAELRCEVLATFIWVNMDSDCVALHEFLGETYDRLKAFPFEIMQRTQAVTVRLPCNWKTIMDNFREAYHIPTAHPEILPLNEPDYLSADLICFENGHSLYRSNGGVHSKYLPMGKAALDGELSAYLRSWDLDPDEFKGREQATRLALQKQKRKLGRERGHPHYDNMSDELLTDAFVYMLFPNQGLLLFADSFMFLRATPHRSDPEKCIFDCWYYATKGEDSFTVLLTEAGNVATGSSEEALREWRNYGEGSLGSVLDGDVGILAAQQEGFHSRGYRGAYLAGQEARVRQYHDEIDRRMNLYVPQD